MLSALQAALADLKEILESARENAIDRKDVPGKMFLPSVEVYKKLFIELHVKTTEEYKEKIFQVNDEEGMFCLLEGIVSLKSSIKTQKCQKTRASQL